MHVAKPYLHGVLLTLPPRGVNNLTQMRSIICRTIASFLGHIDQSHGPAESTRLDRYYQSICRLVQRAPGTHKVNMLSQSAQGIATSLLFALAATGLLVKLLDLNCLFHTLLTCFQVEDVLGVYFKSLCSNRT